MRWGIVDVEAWLGELDPRVFDRWVAFDRVEPISDPWLHTGTIATELHEVVRWLAVARGADLPATLPEDYRPRHVSAAETKDGDQYDQLAAVMNGTMR